MVVDFMRFYCGGYYAGLGVAGIGSAAAGLYITQVAAYHSVSCRVYLGLVTNRGLGAGGLEASALEYECRGVGYVLTRQHLVVSARQFNRRDEVA